MKMKMQIKIILVPFIINVLIQKLSFAAFIKLLLELFVLFITYPFPLIVILAIIIIYPILYKEFSFFIIDRFLGKKDKMNKRIKEGVINSVSHRGFFLHCLTLAFISGILYLISINPRSRRSRSINLRDLYLDLINGDGDGVLFYLIYPALGGILIVLLIFILYKKKSIIKFKFWRFYINFKKNKKAVLIEKGLKLVNLRLVIFIVMNSCWYLSDYNNPLIDFAFVYEVLCTNLFTIFAFVFDWGWVSYMLIVINSLLSCFINKIKMLIPSLFSLFQGLELRSAAGAAAAAGGRTRPGLVMMCIFPPIPASIETLSAYTGLGIDYLKTQIDWTADKIKTVNHIIHLPLVVHPVTPRYAFIFTDRSKAIPLDSIMFTSALKAGQTYVHLFEFRGECPLNSSNLSERLGDGKSVHILTEHNQLFKLTGKLYLLDNNEIFYVKMSMSGPYGPGTYIPYDPIVGDYGNRDLYMKKRVGEHLRIGTTAKKNQGAKILCGNSDNFYFIKKNEKGGVMIRQANPGSKDYFKTVQFNSRVTSGQNRFK